jgi:hypothetical protein
MPSKSLERWSGERSDALDQIATAHARVGGTTRGRRFATEQINHAYTTLLSSQFQGFTRDLHSECVDYIVSGVLGDYQTVLRNLLLRDRKLDRGNPNPGNLGADFGRFGIPFWIAVRADSHGNDARQELLERLNEWRNAIAHQDFDPAKLGGTTTLHLQTVRRWRSALSRLALSFENVMRIRISTLTNISPW